MAWVFVRLKWRLLANAGASRARGGARLARAGGGDPPRGDHARSTWRRRRATAARASWPCSSRSAVGWIMLPLLAGSDRALDVARLAALPLTRRRARGRPLRRVARRSAAGRDACAAVGSGSAPTRPAGPAPRSSVADVLVMTVLSIATGRAVSAGLAAAVHSRRGRDLASVVLAIVSAAGYIAWRLSTALARQVGQLRPSRVTDVLSWTPPGALARSIADAHSGALLAAVGGLVYALAVLVAVGWLWARALERQLTNPAATATGRTRRAASTAPPGPGAARVRPPRPCGSRICATCGAPRCSARTSSPESSPPDS